MSARPTTRMFVLHVLVISIVLTLLGRLWFLQVHENERYAEVARSNQVRKVITPAPRGEIYDVTGTALVRNRTALVVAVNRSELRRQPERGEAVLERLGKVLGKSAGAIRGEITPCGSGVPRPCWKGSPYQPVPVAEYAATDRAGVAKVLAIRERGEEFPGIEVRYAPVRDYPRGRSAAHLLGYLGPISVEETELSQYRGVQESALIGRAGVESSYEEVLRGVDGVEELEVDHVGNVRGIVGEELPQPGSKLVLSIHAGVQQAAEAALERAVAAARKRPDRGGNGNYRADSGSIVVMEAQTGRIVAMASYPSYDPSVFIGGASAAEYAALVDEQRGAPLIFRAIQGTYAPASTFKVISTAAAVEDGYPLRGLYPCPGSYAPLGGKRNFEGVGLGTISLRTSLVKSCDTIYYDFAYKQWLRDGGNTPVARPRDPMLTLAKGFGLGKPTGIDLPSERAGTIPDRQYLQRRWERLRDNYCLGATNPARSPARRAANREFCEDGNRFRAGDAANFSIGQGDTLLTPLQLASVYAAFGNGGKIVSPSVGRALLSPDGRGVAEIMPRVRGKIPVSGETREYIREALGGVTTEGTAARAFAGFPVRVAGKTGTAEVANKQDTAWFASFAPATKADLVVVGVVTQGGTGGTTAAPMVREVYDAIYGVGRSALLPGGKLPKLLPVIRADGTVGAPGTKPAVEPVRTQYHPPQREAERAGGESPRGRRVA